MVKVQRPRGIDSKFSSPRGQPIYEIGFIVSLSHGRELNGHSDTNSMVARTPSSAPPRKELNSVECHEIRRNIWLRDTSQQEFNLESASKL